MTTTEFEPECEACDPVAGLFASRSVAAHLLRGALGLVLAVAGLALAGQSAWSLALLPLAVVSWRGCPTCWTLGLVETRRRTLAARRAARSQGTSHLVARERSEPASA